MGNEWLDAIENHGADPDMFDADNFQAYEKLIHEGLKTQVPTFSSTQWERDNLEDNIDTDVKPFEINEEKRGNWFYPAGEMSDKQKQLSQTLPPEPKQDLTQQVYEASKVVTNAAVTAAGVGLAVGSGLLQGIGGTIRFMTGGGF